MTNSMRIVSTVARYLLGIIFTVVGLNGFLHFIPAGPVPALAAQFVGALIQSHYMTVVFVIQLVGGLLLLANRYVALALTILGPVIVNIVLVHIFMAPAGLPLALFVTLLWILAAYRVRFVFAGIFQAAAYDLGHPPFGHS
jgi:putative oxidoreductase